MLRIWSRPLNDENINSRQAISSRSDNIISNVYLKERLQRLGCDNWYTKTDKISLHEKYQIFIQVIFLFFFFPYESSSETLFFKERAKLLHIPITG